MTKRKAPEEKAMPVRKKPARQAFGAAKDKATKAKSKHNEERSWLSKLPREVRRSIWGHVLGDTVLHLYQSDYSGKSFAQGIESDDEEGQASLHPWKLAVCHKHQSIPALYELSKTALATEPRIEPGYELEVEYWNAMSEAAKQSRYRCDRKKQLCHDECIVSMFQLPRRDDERADHRRESKEWARNLALLRTCRMVYHEANHVLWTTNTFSFSYGDCFLAFMSRRTTTQTKLLTKLHFTWGSSFFWQPKWRKVFSIQMIRKLTHLKELHIYVGEESCDPILQHLLLDFRIQSLNAATVIVEFKESYDTAEESRALSKITCGEWAKELRSALLDPNAPANWQAERDADAARAAQNKEDEKARRANHFTCTAHETAEECRRRNQEKQDAKDVEDGRVRKKPFVAEACGSQHRGDAKRELERRSTNAIEQ